MQSSIDTDEQLTDEQLTALALAADPDRPIDDDAVPYLLGACDDAAPLPAWYMPAPVSSTTSPRRTAIAVMIIMAMVVIPAFGFCITYGQLVLA